MSKYKTEEGTIINTNLAAESWNEHNWWNGRNYESTATGSQWAHQTLYRSSKGRYYIEHTSQWQGSKPHADFVSNEEAAAWLLLNGHDLLPGDLADLESEICE